MLEQTQKTSKPIKNKKRLPYLKKKTFFDIKKNTLDNTLEKDKSKSTSKLKPIYKLVLKLRKKKISLKKKKKYLKRNKKKKLDLFLKSLFLDKHSLLNIIKLKKKKKSLKKLQLNKHVTKKKFLLNINIRSNNIFINLLKYSKKQIKVVKFWSTGVFKLHCTKKKLKFIINTILKLIKKKLKNFSFYVIKILCAHFLHKYLYKNLKKLFIKSKFIIFTSFKIFNGCRSKKKRRKKHLKFRTLR